jgi:hypothetical protein
MGGCDMTHDQVVIILTTAAWSGGVGLVGGVLVWSGRRASVRWLTVGVATWISIERACARALSGTFTRHHAVVCRTRPR